jgi:hypothetical protein
VLVLIWMYKAHLAAGLMPECILSGLTGFNATYSRCLLLAETAAFESLLLFLPWVLLQSCADLALHTHCS